MGNEAGNGVRRSARVAARALLTALFLACVAAAQEARQTEPRFLGWTGKTVAADSLRERIGAASVELDVSGDVAAFEETLVPLWLEAACLDPFEGQPLALRDVAFVRLRLARYVGDYEAARRALVEILPRADDPRFAGRDDVAPATPELLALAREVAAHPYLQQEWRRVPQRVTDDGLPELVRRAVDNGQLDVLQQLGVTAVPHLKQLILADPDRFTESMVADPLYVLLDIDPRAGADFALAHLNEGGRLWKQRILRAMQALRPLSDEDTWTMNGAGDGPPICLEPGWLDLLAAFVEAPETARAVIPQVSEAWKRDNLTPPLQRALVAALARGDASFSDALLHAQPTVVAPSSRPVLEAALASTNPRLRRMAALALTEFDEPKVLLEYVGDPDPHVRRAVAESLRPRDGMLGFVKAIRADGIHFYYERKVHYVPRIGPRDRDALTALARDPSSEVRAEAAAAIVALVEPLPDEVYVALATDDSDSVRAAMLGAGAMTPAIRGRVLAELVRADDHELWQRVERELGSVSWEAQPTAYQPALRAMLLDERAPQLRSLVQRATVDPEGLRTVIHCALAWDTDWLLLQAQSFRPYTDSWLPAVRRLSDDDFLHLVRRLHRNQSFEDWTSQFVDDAFPPRMEALLALASDPTVDFALRLMAACSVARAGGTRVHDLLLDLLPAAEPFENDYGWWSTTGHRLPSSERNAFLLELARDPRAPMPQVAWLVGGYAPTEAGGDELSDLILERWLTWEGEALQVVGTALESMADQPRERVDWDALRRALRTDDYARAAVRTLESIQDPNWVSAIGLCLLQHPDGATRNAAASALARFVIPEAAAYLLQGLNDADWRVVEECKRALARLETYQGHARRQAELFGELPTREGALNELATMLDEPDAEIRAQAALGVAALGAKEMLPRLIRMLKDPETSVAAAASEALRLLRTAPEPKEETPARDARARAADDPSGD